LAVLCVRSDVGQINAKEAISRLITIRELSGFEHQHGIWQIIQYLGERVPAFFGLQLHDEELREDASDEIRHQKHQGHPKWYLENHDFLIRITVLAYDRQLNGQ